MIEKCPTGIRGLDEVTNGGLPKDRPTLICGGAGSGKMLFAMEFLMHGAIEYGEPGVFMTFEETPQDLAKNFYSLGFNLPEMMSRGLIETDHISITRSEIEETGEYDLEGLFIRLSAATDAIGAKRVVLDTIETLFSELPNATILRAELRRLFLWLKGRGVTAIVTGKSGDKTLTQYGLEEYVADCVVLLDFRCRLCEFEKICEEHLAGRYSIEVVDLLINPQLAKGDQIIAIPKLVRKLSEPLKKIIGNLANTQRVLVGPDIRPVS